MEDIDDWFHQVRQLCATYNISTPDIWDVDETDFMIGIAKDLWVLTRDVEQPSYLGSSTNREFVPVNEAVSSSGSVITPMIILPGKVHQEDYSCPRVVRPLDVRRSTP